MVRINDKTQEPDAIRHRARDGAFFVKRQAQFLQAMDDCLAPLKQRLLIICEQDEIIHNRTVKNTCSVAPAAGIRQWRGVCPCRGGWHNWFV